MAHASSLLAGAARKVLDLESERDRLRAALERIRDDDLWVAGDTLESPLGPVQYRRRVPAAQVAAEALEGGR